MGGAPLIERDLMKQETITDIRAFVLEQTGSGGDYHDREKGTLAS